MTKPHEKERVQRPQNLVNMISHDMISQDMFQNELYLPIFGIFGYIAKTFKDSSEPVGGWAVATVSGFQISRIPRSMNMSNPRLPKQAKSGGSL